MASHVWGIDGKEYPFAITFRRMNSVSKYDWCVEKLEYGVWIYMGMHEFRFKNEMDAVLMALSWSNDL